MQLLCGVVQQQIYRSRERDSLKQVAVGWRSLDIGDLTKLSPNPQNSGLLNEAPLTDCLLKKQASLMS